MRTPDLVAKGFKFRLNVPGDAIGNVNDIRGHAEPGDSYCLLGIHTKYQAVEYALQHAHGDVGTPGRADDQIRLFVFKYDGG